MEHDVATAWPALLGALRSAGYAVDELIRPGAGDAEIRRAEQAVGHRFPAELAELYRLSDGQVDWYSLTHGPGGDPQRARGAWVCSIFGDGWSFAPLAELVTDWEGWRDVRSGYTEQELADNFDDVIDVRDGDPVEKRYTSEHWIAFAVDGGGNALAVDLAPAPGGTVGQVIVIGPDEDLRRVVSPGVAALLRRCTDALTTGDPGTGASGGVLLYDLKT